jgi:ABC-type sulfate/molybdate transport systems ATPase subunit
MCKLFSNVREHTGVTTLHVTHSPGEARRLANKILMLRDGAIQNGA